MIHIRLVGDGERDEATVPHLMRQILGEGVQASFKAWRAIRLNRGHGYSRKLKFAIREALDDSMAGLVAVVDRDKDSRRGRLGELRKGREEHRNNPGVANPIFPTALGEAVPHGEAWLLDDAIAVKDTLALDGGMSIPSIRNIRDPKSALNELIAPYAHREGKTLMEVLVEIACRVDHLRCVHGGDTGFKEFAEDILREFRVDRGITGR